MSLASGVLFLASCTNPATPTQAERATAEEWMALVMRGEHDKALAALAPESRAKSPDAMWLSEQYNVEAMGRAMGTNPTLTWTEVEDDFVRLTYVFTEDATDNFAMVALRRSLGKVSGVRHQAADLPATAEQTARVARLIVQGRDGTLPDDAFHAVMPKTAERDELVGVLKTQAGRYAPTQSVEALTGSLHCASLQYGSAPELEGVLYSVTCSFGELAVRPRFTVDGKLVGLSVKR